MTQEFIPSTIDHCTAPVMSYAEIVEVMRARGDKTLTVNSVGHYITSAHRKLKPLLEDLAGELE
jgi:hypothetical protein